MLCACLLSIYVPTARWCTQSWFHDDVCVCVCVCVWYTYVCVSVGRYVYTCVEYAYGQVFKLALCRGSVPVGVCGSVFGGRLL